MTHSGLEALLDGRRLSPVQRRIAYYLGEHLDEAIFLSSVELAERAGVSQPSVTRFAMVLGFAGYPELRQALRPLVLGGKPVEGSLIRTAIDGEIRNLGVVRERLAALPIKELGESLAATEPLPVLGLRVSSGLATTFAYYARRIHPDVRLLVHGGQSSSTGCTRLAGRGPSGASGWCCRAIPSRPCGRWSTRRRPGCGPPSSRIGPTSRPRSCSTRPWGTGSCSTRTPPPRPGHGPRRGHGRRRSPAYSGPPGGVRAHDR